MIGYDWLWLWLVDYSRQTKNKKQQTTNNNNKNTVRTVRVASERRRRGRTGLLNGRGRLATSGRRKRRNHLQREGRLEVAKGLNEMYEQEEGGWGGR